MYGLLSNTTTCSIMFASSPYPFLWILIGSSLRHACGNPPVSPKQIAVVGEKNISDTPGATTVPQWPQHGSFGQHVFCAMAGLWRKANARVSVLALQGTGKNAIAGLSLNPLWMQNGSTWCQHQHLLLPRTSCNQKQFSNNKSFSGDGLYQAVLAICRIVNIYIYTYFRPPYYYPPQIIKTRVHL